MRWFPDWRPDGANPMVWRSSIVPRFTWACSCCNVRGRRCGSERVDAHLLFVRPDRRLGFRGRLAERVVGDGGGNASRGHAEFDPDRYAAH